MREMREEERVCVEERADRVAKKRGRERERERRDMRERMCGRES